MPDCPSCGQALDAHNRHVRFTLPIPVLDLPDREHTSGTWMSHATPRESVMMQVPGTGAFVRVLLPVQLPWDLFPMAATATAGNADETPYITSSTDPQLAAVLTNSWPHEDVLAHLPA